MMKKCNQCGCVLEEDEKFCHECGTASHNVNEVDETEVPKVNMYESSVEPNENSTTPVDMYEQESVNVSEKNIIGTSKISILLGVISLIFGIMSIFTLGCFLYPEIIAIICGMLSKNSAGKKTKLGKAGFICGLIGTSILVIIIVLALI